MNEIEKFESQKRANIQGLGQDQALRRMGTSFLRETLPYKYTYNFTWLGIPIIQLPQDLLAMQEIIWEAKPDLIVETGVAHGGSLVFYASMLELLGGEGRVLGIDIDIRAHNRERLERHPLMRRIDLIQGSSVEENTVMQVKALAEGRSRVLVALDSNHAHDHVLQELKLYSPLVRQGGYIVVFDTAIADMPQDAFPGKPWNKSHNPKTAVREFLSRNDRFEVAADIENKLIITVSPEGYLRCIKD